MALEVDELSGFWLTQNEVDCGYIIGPGCCVQGCPLKCVTVPQVGPTLLDKSQQILIVNFLLLGLVRERADQLKGRHLGIGAWKINRIVSIEICL